MIQFDMRRFLSVARWDVTVNRRFYLSQATGLLVLAAFPVVLRYMFGWAAGDLSLFGMSEDADLGHFGLTGDGDGLAVYYGIVNGCLPVVYLSYMFHNLVRKQGRIAELTLPASNVERFVWHAVFSLVAPQVVFALSVPCADVLNLLFAALFGILSQAHSLTLAWLRSDTLAVFSVLNAFDHSFLVYVAAVLSSFCFVSTFALGNAWKYRYNLIFTCMAHVLFWIVLSVVLMFLAGIFVQVGGLTWQGYWDFNFNPSVTTMLVVVCLAELSLLVGIWALTYKLYCNAQVTSRRNR